MNTSAVIAMLVLLGLSSTVMGARGVGVNGEFPYCGCYARGTSPFKVSYPSSSTVPKGIRYCFDVSAYAQPGRCGSFDITKVELDIAPNCAAVSDITFDGRTYSASYNRYPGTVPKTVFKVTGGKTALATFASVSSKGAKFCFTVPSQCPLNTFCRGGNCEVAFFDVTHKCCPVTTTTVTVKKSPSPSPCPSPSPSPCPSPSPRSYPSPVPSPCPSPVPSPVPSPYIYKPVPSPVPSPCPSPVPSPCPSPVPRPCPSPVPSPVPSPYIYKPVPSPVPSPCPSPVPSPVPSPCPSPVPSPCPSPVPSPVPSPCSSPVPSPVPSPFIYKPVPSPVPSPCPSPVPSPVPSPYIYKPVPSPVPSPCPSPVPSPVPSPYIYKPVPSPVPSPCPSPVPSPVSIPPSGFPYCQCNKRVQSSYTLKKASSSSYNKDVTTICFDLNTQVVASRDVCANRDLRKIEIEIENVCRGAIRVMTFDGQVVAPSFSNHEDSQGLHTVFKITKPDSASNPLCSFAKAQRTQSKVCITLSGNTCNSMEKLCKNGSCTAAFFAAGEGGLKCCPMSSVVY